jgi:ABC-type Fe3+/spermidine/putrescine transport system ATPase subunit
MTAGGSVDVLGVTHRFGSDFALTDLDLSIRGGEFITFLGPSGCGKTTLLRMIAGFLEPSRGRIMLDGEDITSVSPHRRPVNMVFQRPTLFPHLDVRENVGFGLKLAKVSRREIDRRVGETLELVRLGDLTRRRNDELSGGQMQRVALARALVNEPRVLLLDEPLSALDLAIRLELEAELRRLHRETAATFVYVTHNQHEALAVSDRIVVFGRGCIEQIGLAEEIYRRPCSPYVARFVGDANVLPVDVDDRRIAWMGGRRVPAADEAMPGPAWLVIRQENIRFDGANPDGGLAGEVLDVALRGSGRSYVIACHGLEAPVKVERHGEREARAVGDSVVLRWEPSATHLLPRPPEGPA